MSGKVCRGARRGVKREAARRPSSGFCYRARMILRRALPVLLALALGGCATARVADLDASAEPLRSRFDRDAAAVRVLVLASPT